MKRKPKRVFVRERLEEYFGVGNYSTNVKPGRGDAQRADHTFRCCGGYGEHFADCVEPCVYCGKHFDPEARWPRRRANGPNGYPAHSGCLEQVGWDAYLDRDGPRADR